MAKRIHELAKELSVKSTAIVAKCKAEGLPGIKNHMSTLSAGLEATIREWFSDGEHTTTVETAAHVDLEKVKVKKRSRSRKKTTKEQTGTTTAVASETTDGGVLAKTESETKHPAAGTAVVDSQTLATNQATGTTITAEPETQLADQQTIKQESQKSKSKKATTKTKTGKSTKTAKSKSAKPKRLSPSERLAVEAQTPNTDTLVATTETSHGTDTQQAGNIATAAAEITTEKTVAELAPGQSSGDTIQQPGVSTVTGAESTNNGLASVAGVTETSTADKAGHAETGTTDTTEQKQKQTEQNKHTSGPRVIGTLKPQELSKVKPVDYVPAPVVLQGPKVIRTVPVQTTRPTQRRRPPASSFGARGSVIGGDIAPVKPGKDKSRRHKTLGEPGTEPGTKKSLKKSKRGGRRSRWGYDNDDISPTRWARRDMEEREKRLAAASGTKLHNRERRLKQTGKNQTSSTPEPVRVEKAEIKEPVTVKDLCAAIGVRAHDVISKLMELGVMATINQTIEADAAIMVALEFGVELTVQEKTLLLDELQKKVDQKLKDAEAEKTGRPPVVAFLGHVDHGKTSLLDRIRKSSVTSGEAGGITQHIGSYLYDDGIRRVTFLDTPGHKAFTQMRARGANMTDIVVLVVAADDGVMPQTEEAINHAKAARVPVVVALNKMDMPNADPTRVLGQLAEKGLTPAEWGGDVEVVRTSAATGEGIDDLVEHLDYIAELHQLKALPTGPATGWVVEAEMSPKQGVLARLLIRDGLLKPYDVIVSGCSYGRIRNITDATGKEISQAGPSMPVEVTGLDRVPTAGDRFFVVESISQAAEIAREQLDRQREKTLANRRQITLENLFSEIAAGEVRELNVIVKADVQGSVDVVCNTITELNTNEVAVKVLHAAVGGINESDILLAEASNAIIIGFQVVADEYARKLAEKSGVEIRLYRVIYQISDDIKQALEGMLKPSIEEKILGRAEVRQLFKISRYGVIAGCYVTEGVINRSAKVRLIRDNVVIRDNCTLESIRRLKNDTNEVRSGLECGIKIAGFDDIKTGDIIEAYDMIEISRKLESSSENNNQKQNKS